MRLYVTSIDAASGTVTVGGREALAKREMSVEDVLWFGEPGPARASVQIRHRHPAREASLEMVGQGRARVVFDEPEHAIAPGQAAVFYSGDAVMGGGFIA